MDGTARAPSVAAVLLELTDTLGPGFDTGGHLYHLAAVSLELLDVDAAGVLLLDEDGRLVEVAATHDSTNDLEQLQAKTDRGPCLESVRAGQAVFCADLEQEDYRWPDFTRLARASGFRSLHAEPLRLRSDIVGGLNLFRRTTGRLTDTDCQTAHLLATATATGLLYRRTVHQRDTLNDQLRHALASRVVIEQAKGFLVARHGVSPDLGFALLRAHARHEREPLTAVAQAVIDGRVSLA
jgi:hypothetical protein